MARKPKRVPLGDPLPEATDADLNLGESAIAGAVGWWERYCPPGWEKLLDAKDDDGTEDPAS